MKILKYLLALIVILILLFIGKGLMTPSIAYECELQIDKPAKDAWAVMSDETKVSQWIKGFKRTELISGTANTVGAVSKMYVVEGGEEVMMEETITAIEEFKHMAMTFTMDFMDMDYEISLNEEGGKTTMHTKSTTRGNGILARSIVSFMPGAMKAQEEENLNNLKKLIEENTTNYFPESIEETLEEM